ncbi:hypothetical protein BK133_23260 [Paenibacillus sp. FSL H8-0548]|uniref:hypothetical protein n=1 Tax=Paenibacillus sp. FSL H8-0548 TaxID=1920422 RepID=UPI00096CD851|nr:hypothetical protein [Paenibacillus sp. FSL H8-0548]OMF24139.1 hypothetical protein BK133_23260 [Paenibacillus sp. FSL H8-0548]
MNRFLKLVHMEIHRFRWVLIGLLSITAVCQISALIWTLKKALAQKEEQLLGDIGRSSYYADVPDIITFEWAMFNTQMWFILPILLCIGVLSVYVFFVWYRDWMGRNTFIYRLLMLPTARHNLYFAKITAFLLFVFTIVAFQLILLPVEEFVLKLVVPADLRAESHILDVLTINQALVELIPRQFEQFFYKYGLGTVAVLAIFTAILLERSYRRWGILYGLLYLLGCVLVVTSPIFYFGLNSQIIYLYPNEIYLLAMFLFILVASVSVWLGIRLLAKKITV